MATQEELHQLISSINTLLALPAAQQLLQLNSNTCERAYAFRPAFLLQLAGFYD